MKPIYHSALGAATISFICYSLFITGVWINYFAHCNQTSPVALCTLGFCGLIFTFIPVSICYVIGRIVSVCLFNKD